MFNLREEQFNWQKTFQQNQLNQQNELTTRGQNLNFMGGIMGNTMNVGSSLIGNLLSYNHAQDVLNFQKEQNQQRRDDLTNEGLPLSYLHIGSGLGRSIGGNIPMMRTQGFGRSTSNPWGFANSGQNLRETHGPPPAYTPSARQPGPRPPASTTSHLRGGNAPRSEIPGVEERMDAGGYLKL